MISAVLVYLDESEKIIPCLESIKDFADEIIIVDISSKDKLYGKLQKFQVKIIKHEFVPYVELLRNYAISKASGNWILVLDPDEHISNNLKEKLKEIKNENIFEAVKIPRKNIFFGKWIVHTNWWPDKHVRFFKKNAVSWKGEIHRYPKVLGKTYELEAKEDLAIIHHGYDSFNQFVERQNRYSAIEAQNLYKIGERFSFGNFIRKPFREFLVRYIRHAGFLDGFYGFALSYLMMVYQLQVMISLWELERKK